MHTTTGAADAAALSSNMANLRDAHALLHALTPVGVVAYKPVNSHGGCKDGYGAARDQPCDGEAHVFDFVAALGIPLFPTHIYPSGAPPTAAFFSIHSLKDPNLPALLEHAQSTAVEMLVTDGLLKRLPSRLAALLRADTHVHILNVSNNPKALLASPPADRIATRDALLRRIGLSLVAPSAWVALYPFADATGAPTKWALMNLADKPINAAVTILNGKAWNGTVEGRGWVVSV